MKEITETIGDIVFRIIADKGFAIKNVESGEILGHLIEYTKDHRPVIGYLPLLGIEAITLEPKPTGFENILSSKMVRNPTVIWEFYTFDNNRLYPIEPGSEKYNRYLTWAEEWLTMRVVI